MDSKIKPEINGRLMCIDALRGFDMLWIIGGAEALVSLSKATGFGFLSNMEVNFDHTWGTFHFYDLIMPLFLFIVGVVMPISFANRIRKGADKKTLYKHVLKRVIILYFLGLIASGHLLTFDKSQIHLWTDTLHAIAAGYLISSVMILEASRKWQFIITAVLLFAYWIMMSTVPVPGAGAGRYEPESNLALYIDNAILGHWQEGAGWTYILTSLTFVCSVMLGVFAGQLLQSDKTQMKKVLILAITGISCIIAGRIWGIWFPIIHHLWTSSLVLFAGGINFLLLAIFYYIIDIKGYRKWAFFFKVIGMNAIAVYVATHLFDFREAGNVFTGALYGRLGTWAGFVESSAALAIIWIILYWMYKNKTFIKI